ncbi:MAG: hypothetical protein NZM28_04135 [Fimbriimonadales bacterium]|nr:hypothetical protein [Fimbriimonadales bacterium]
MNAPQQLDGWTQHARDEFGDILGQPPSDQQMRQLLGLWSQNAQSAFRNRRGRWQVKVRYTHKRKAYRLWLIAGEQDNQWLLWTVFEVE